MSRPRVAPEVRFISFVNETSNCWEWTGSCTIRPKCQYGRFRLPDKTVYAHRWLWEYINGPIPVGKQLCHTCDNSRCVRLAHIYIGTAKTNSDDKISRGRQIIKGYPKTSNKEDSVIRKLYLEGVPVAKIAFRYNVHPMTVYRRLKYLKGDRHVKHFSSTS